MPEIGPKTTESESFGKDVDDTVFSAKTTRWKRLIRNVVEVCSREMGSEYKDFIAVGGSQMPGVGTSLLDADWLMRGGRWPMTVAGTSLLDADWLMRGGRWPMTVVGTSLLDADWSMRGGRWPMTVSEVVWMTVVVTQASTARPAT